MICHYQLLAYINRSEQYKNIDLSSIILSTDILTFTGDQRQSDFAFWTSRFSFSNVVRQINNFWKLGHWVDKVD